MAEGLELSRATDERMLGTVIRGQALDHDQTVPQATGPGCAPAKLKKPLVAEISGHASVWACF